MVFKFQGSRAEDKCSNVMASLQERFGKFSSYPDYLSCVALQVVLVELAK